MSREPSRGGARVTRRGTVLPASVAFLAARWARGAPSAVAAAPAQPASDLLPPDYPVARGHFYTQAGGEAPAAPGDRGRGFVVADGPQLPLWSLFRRSGGVATLGYPVSSRFTPPDASGLRFIYQATQRGLLQADVASGEAGLANVLELLGAAGLDAELDERHRIPPSADWTADAGSEWDGIVERHFGLLDSPGVPAALRGAYLANPDAIVQWGLPMGFRDYGSVAALRAQRAVLQLWREPAPWAAAGAVLLAPLGDLLKAYGLVPASALVAVPGPDPVARGALRLESAALVDAASGFRVPIGLPGAHGAASATLLDTSTYRLSVTSSVALEYPLSGRVVASLASGGTPAGPECGGCEVVVQRGEALQTLELGPITPRAGLDALGLELALLPPAGGVADGTELSRVSLALPVEVLTGTAAAARRLRDAGFRALPAEQALALGVRELVAEGASSFHGSPPERSHNIRLAASRLNGASIAPGATFSFLRSLGEISAAAGYREGLIIEGDQTVPGVGGGVCQVSTTMFRCAFWAGVPILERHQHSYRVGYYEQHSDPVGFDAAVYSPGLDLRWTNDTGHTLVLQTEFDPSGELSFKLYGVKPGRRVEFRTTGATNVVPPGPPLPDSPDPRLPRGTRRQVEFASAGADVTITRTVRAADGAERTDRFASRFVPWRAKWVYGTR
jgi:hypothetical protein